MKIISLFWPFALCVAFAIAVAALVQMMLPPTAKSVPPGSELTPKMERAFGKSNYDLVKDVVEYNQTLKDRP